MSTTLDYDGYYRDSSSTPSYLSFWRTGTTYASADSSSTIAAFRTNTATGGTQEAHGIGQDGGTPFLINEAGGVYWVSGTSPVANEGVSLPSNIVAAMDVMSGSAVDMGALVVITEAESSTLQSGTTPTPTLGVDAGLSGGFGSLFAGVTPSTDRVYYTITVPAARTYDIRVRYSSGLDRGTYQVAIWNGSSYVNQGTAIDMYNATPGYVETDLGNLTFTSVNNKFVKFTLTGKNGSSSASNMMLDFIKLIPVSTRSQTVTLMEEHIFLICE